MWGHLREKVDQLEKCLEWDEAGRPMNNTLETKDSQSIPPSPVHFCFEAAFGSLVCDAPSTATKELTASKTDWNETSVEMKAV